MWATLLPLITQLGHLLATGLLQNISNAQTLRRDMSETMWWDGQRRSSVSGTKASPGDTPSLPV